MTPTAYTRCALLASLTALGACGGGGGDSPAPAPAPAPVACTSTPPPPPPVTVSAAPQVVFAVTNGAGVSGTVVLTLDRTAAPATVANFLQYVNSGFYNCTVIHRHAPNFVLQGGGFASPMTVSSTALNSPKATNPPIVLEDNNGLSNLRLTIAMARTNVPDSATSQFFINLADNRASLDRVASPLRRGYAVFGSVTAGADVITAATTAPCAAWGSIAFGDGSCLPVPNIIITAASQTR